MLQIDTNQELNINIMNKDKIVIANWKMKMSFEGSLEFLSKLKNSELFAADIVILPPVIWLKPLIERFGNINFGAQNVSYLEKDLGAFSGEVSALMLKEAGVKYSLCGHSERRQFFKETNIQVKLKAEHLLSKNISPIICIGENLKTKEIRETKKFLKNQIIKSIPKTSKDIIVAYEPIWAIGSGMIPEMLYLEDNLNFIKETISKVAKNARLVYGGSVDHSSMADISKIKYLDGVLVGGASLKFNEFIKILKYYA
jgi:triosephosphate isomerase (TIM)